MAEEQQDTEQGTSSARQKLKMTILIGVGVVLIMTLSVAGTWFLLSSADSAGTESSQTEGPGMKDGAMMTTDGPAMYLAMQPPFVVNYTSGARTRFLQLELSLVSRSPAAIDTANAHMPLIRNNLLDVLARQDFDELQTMEGKQALVEELTAAVQAVMQEKLGHPGIETVLFRSFVMQ